MHALKGQRNGQIGIVALRMFVLEGVYAQN